MTPKRTAKGKETTIRILIADDHAIVRFGLSSLLQYEPDIAIVGEAEDGETAVRLVKTLKPDVAVIDLAMPGIGGVEAIRQIRQCTPETRIVVFTSFGTSEEISLALEAGISGVVLKDEGNDALLKAIRRVAAGESVIPRELKADRRPEPPIDLSEQELEVLSALARGLTNKDISSITGLTKDVTKHLISDIFAKLGVANRAEAVAIALRKKLLMA